MPNIRKDRPTQTLLASLSEAQKAAVREWLRDAAEQFVRAADCAREAYTMHGHEGFLASHKYNQNAASALRDMISRIDPMVSQIRMDNRRKRNATCGDATERE